MNELSIKSNSLKSKTCETSFNENDLSRISPLPWLYNNNYANESTDNKVSRNKRQYLEENNIMSNRPKCSGSKKDDDMEYYADIEKLRKNSVKLSTSMRTKRDTPSGFLKKRKNVRVINSPKMNSIYKNKLPLNSTLEADFYNLNFANEKQTGFANSNNINNSRQFNKNKATTAYMQHSVKSSNPNQQKRLWNMIRYKAKEIKNIMPTVKDINIIDKYSRVVFPNLFLLFNLCYWCFYFVQSSFILEITN